MQEVCMGEKPGSNGEVCCFMPARHVCDHAGPSAGGGTVETWPLSDEEERALGLLGETDDERGIRLHGPLYRRRRCTNCKMVYPFGRKGSWRHVDGEVQHCGCHPVAQAGHFPSEPVPPEDPWSERVDEADPPVEVNEDG